MQERRAGRTRGRFESFGIEVDVRGDGGSLDA